MKYKILTIQAFMIVMFASCTKKLDTVPIDPLVTTSATVFGNAAGYKQALAKLYASLAISGQTISFSEPDIQAADQGTACFLREYWAAEEVTTDECINAWGDGGLVEYHGGIWSDNNMALMAAIFRMHRPILANNVIAPAKSYVLPLPVTLKQKSP